MKSKLHYLFLLLVVILPIGCATSNYQSNADAPADFKKPAKGGKVYKPAGEWTIRKASDLDPLVKLGAKVTNSGGVLKVNLNGVTIDGSRQRGDGGQSENQTPLFRAKTPLMVENGFVTNNKNAATFYSPNSGMKNVTFDRVGEDAVATQDGAKNFLLQNCQFSGAEDKTIQLNEASGARVIGNTVVGGFTGARIGKISYSTKNDRAYCSRNKFINVDTGWNVATVTLEVTAKNSYQNVRLPFKTSPGGKIKNADGAVSND